MLRLAPASIVGVVLSFTASACLVGNAAWDGQSSTDGTNATSGGTAPNVDTETTTTAGESSTGDDPPTSAECVPLAPAASGMPVIDVLPSQAAELASLVAAAAPGTTFRLADGEYALAGASPIVIAAAGVVLRSASGDASAVVLDGGDGPGPLVRVTASDVTLAEITLARATASLVEVLPSATEDTSGLRLHRLELRDTDGFMVSLGDDASVAAGNFADDGEITCSRFSIGDAYRETHDCFGMSAIKSFGGSGWSVRDNVFEQLWCPQGAGFVAVHFGYGGRDNVVDRNQFRDVYRAVMLGFEVDGVGTRAPPAGTTCPSTVQHFGGAVRNNMFWVGGTALAASGIAVDAQISAWSACGVDIQHNTVVSLFPVFSEIEYRFTDTSGSIVNNLLTADVLARDPAAVVDAGNQGGIGLEQFVDPGGGDLHLASGATTPIAAAVEAGAPAVSDDIDGDPREGVRDVGADERVD